MNDSFLSTPDWLSYVHLTQHLLLLFLASLTLEGKFMERLLKNFIFERLGPGTNKTQFQSRSLRLTSVYTNPPNPPHHPTPPQTEELLQGTEEASFHYATLLAQAACVRHACAMRVPCVRHACAMRAPCVRHACAMRVPCVSWPLLLTSFSLSLLFFLLLFFSVFCF